MITKSITIDAKRVFKVFIQDGFDCNDLNTDELEMLCNAVLDSTEMQSGINSLIADEIDHYIQNDLDDYRTAMAEGKLENDAYEKHKQKQIDGKA